MCEATPNRVTTGECYIPLTLYGRGRGSSAVWLPGSPPHGPGARETSGRSRVTCRGGPTRASCLEGPRGRGRPLDACSAACDSSSSRKTWRWGRGGREKTRVKGYSHSRFTRPSHGLHRIRDVIHWPVTARGKLAGVTNDKESVLSPYTKLAQKHFYKVIILPYIKSIF